MELCGVSGSFVGKHILVRSLADLVDHLFLSCKFEHVTVPLIAPITSQIICSIGGYRVK